MDKIAAFFESANLSGWDILLAVLALVAGFVFGSLAKRAVLAVGRRWPTVSSALVALLARVVKYLIVLLGVGVALAFLGANLQPLIVSVIIVGLIAALALRDIAANWGAAIVLQSRRPIDVGQWVEIQGYVGTVQDLTARSVIVHTVDGRSVHIPNSLVVDNPLVNLSERGALRTSIQVRMLTTDRFATLAALVAEAAASADGLGDRPVQVRATQSGSDRMTLGVDFWHDPSQWEAVTSNVVVAVTNALKDAGIEATVTSLELADPIIPQPSV